MVNDDISIAITRDQFKYTIKPIISKLDSFWKQTIMKANIKPDSINHVFLTGGGAYIPSIQNLFRGFNIFNEQQSNAYGCWQYLINYSHS